MALPDTWEVDFGIDPKVLDQRLMTPTGPDVYAMQYGAVQPENLTTVFADPQTPNPDFAGRAISDFDPYSRYYWIDTQKVPNEMQRQAMAVALNREAIRLNGGGVFAGELGDGVIKPNLGMDYAPTGWATDLFGEADSAGGQPRSGDSADRRLG